MTELCGVTAHATIAAWGRAPSPMANPAHSKSRSTSRARRAPCGISTASCTRFSPIVLREAQTGANLPRRASTSIATGLAASWWRTGTASRRTARTSMVASRLGTSMAATSMASARSLVTSRRSASRSSTSTPSLRLQATTVTTRRTLWPSTRCSETKRPSRACVTRHARWASPSSSRLTLLQQVRQLS